MLGIRILLVFALTSGVLCSVPAIDYSDISSSFLKRHFRLKGASSKRETPSDKMATFLAWCRAIAPMELNMNITGYIPHERYRSREEFECEGAYYFGVLSMEGVARCLGQDHLLRSSIPIPDAVSIFGAMIVKETGTPSKALSEFFRTFQGTAETSVSAILRQTALRLYQRLAEDASSGVERSRVENLFRATITLHLSTVLLPDALRLLYLGLPREETVFYGVYPQHVVIVVASRVDVHEGANDSELASFDATIINSGLGLNFHRRAIQHGARARLALNHQTGLSWQDLEDLDFFLCRDAAHMYTHAQKAAKDASQPLHLYTSQKQTPACCVGTAFFYYLRYHAMEQDSQLRPLTLRFQQALMELLLSSLAQANHIKTDEFQARVSIYHALLVHAIDASHQFAHDISTRARQEYRMWARHVSKIARRFPGSLVPLGSVVSLSPIQADPVSSSEAYFRRLPIYRSSLQDIIFNMLKMQDVVTLTHMLQDLAPDARFPQMIGSFFRFYDHSKLPEDSKLLITLAASAESLHAWLSHAHLPPLLYIADCETHPGRHLPLKLYNSPAMLRNVACSAQRDGLLIAKFSQLPAELTAGGTVPYPSQEYAAGAVMQAMDAVILGCDEGRFRSLPAMLDFTRVRPGLHRYYLRFLLKRRRPQTAAGFSAMVYAAPDFALMAFYQLWKPFSVEASYDLCLALKSRYFVPELSAAVAGAHKGVIEGIRDYCDAYDFE